MFTDISLDLLKLFQGYYQNTIRTHLEDFPILSTMLGYSMGWNDVQGNPEPNSGGKQLRPLLTLLSATAMDGFVENALPLASAIELIHTFSLIHDDVMDNSAMRRGRPSVWNVWGVNQAINAGDGAYGLSFQLLADAEYSLDIRRVLRAEAMLGNACVDTVQGQMLDISFEDRETVSVGEYTTMTSLKTGPLIGLAMAGGALLAGADLETVNALDITGRTLGVAFQIQDDILGIWGDPEKTGKANVDDLVQKKKSLPVLWALENVQNEQLHQLYQEPAPLSLETTKAIYDILTAHEVRRVVEEEADRHYQTVVRDIRHYYPDNETRAEMLTIVDFIVNRNF
ncbi:MAG: polyprenyl synthetase family protein [Chloroflexi bacterium]|nr:polyprenyl synthetase family protein [Chloroflexota bacterium]